MTPDVNVLVAASRSDHPHHKIALKALSQALEQTALGGVLSVFPFVAASMLRLVTNAKIFINPTPIDAALGFLDSLLLTPGVRLENIGPEWPTLRSLCLSHQLSANAIPDAWLAACALSKGKKVITFDKDLLKLLPRRQVILLENDENEKQ